MVTEDGHNWQEKYSQLENSLAEQESGWRQSEQRWLQVLRNVVYLLDYEDEQATKKLQAIKSLIRQRADLTAIDKAIETLVEATDQLPASMQSGAAEYSQSGGIFSKLFGFTDRKPVAELERQQCAVTEAENSLRDILLAILDGIEVAKNDNVVFGALKSRIETASEADFKLLLPDLIDTINGFTAAGQQQRVEGSGSSYSSIFLNFIEQLSLPGELQVQANLIKSRLDQNINDHDLQMPLRAAVTLVTDMRSLLEKEKAEFQYFLINLTEKLHDLESDLFGTQDCFQHLNQSGEEIEKKVQVQVNAIEGSVTQAGDLDTLKDAVKGQLAQLRNSLDAYKKNDMGKQDAMAAELSRLKDKLQSVEKNTDALRESLKEKYRQAELDPLTGIFNRLAFDQRMDREYARWNRYQSPLALLIADVDLFKSINDRFGHMAGDNALRYVAKMMLDALRETDFVARYGGEEFVILLPEGEKTGILQAAEKLRAQVDSSRFHSDGKVVPITISIGVAQFHRGDKPDDVFIRADAALYLAKQNGRNQTRHEDDLVKDAGQVGQ